MNAGDVQSWLRARQLAGRLKRESFAATRVTAADAFGAACGLMDLATQFQSVPGVPDLVRERDERESRDAWRRLRERSRIQRR